MWTQDDIDVAFADMDSLLAEREPPVPGIGRCSNCGGVDLVPAHNPGAIHCYGIVCNSCGAEQRFIGDAQIMRRSSNYKRIHHWHERVSQLLLCESRIPDAEFLQIAERLLDGSYSVINKDNVRAVLRSLNMQLYIEKWLQIIQRITGIQPPQPGGQLLLMLDNLFVALQEPFRATRDPKRKNFLNYNYVFCRLLQQIGCDSFCIFFPLIKSKVKLAVLDSAWERMVTYQGLPFVPLRPVPTFSVRLEKPKELLAEIRETTAHSIQAAQSQVHEQMEIQRLDLPDGYGAYGMPWYKRARLNPLAPWPRWRRW